MLLIMESRTPAINRSAPEQRVLRILANLNGDYLYLDGYDESTGQRLEQTDAPFSKREIANILESLEKQGLVTSILNAWMARSLP
jgi:hypothetical protein